MCKRYVLKELAARMLIKYPPLSICDLISRHHHYPMCTKKGY